MKRVLTIVALLFPFLVFAQNEANEVKKCFGFYRDAILQDRGGDAVNFVDSKTINYYNEVLQHVRNDDSVKLQHLSLFDRLMVLSVRHQLTKKELQGKNGKGLFTLSVQKGLISKASLQGTDLGEVNIDKVTARGQMLVNKQKTPVFMNFYKENNVWKMNLTSTFEQTTESIQRMLKRSKKSENEFLLVLLKSANNVEPTRNIWKPLL